MQKMASLFMNFLFFSNNDSARVAIDGNAGPFYAQVCTGHRGHFGGGKHPPPTMPLMQHAGALAYTERKAPCYRTVFQGSGAEETAVIGGEIEGEHREGL